MPKIAFVEKSFQPKTLAVIAQANAICAEYASQGLNMTLRQLYYQFVARGLIRNKQSEYDRLGSIVNDARLAGLLDWTYIVDLTRELDTLPHWNSGAEAQKSIAEWYLFDKWAMQDHRIEVWIEKEALAGVIQPICRELDVPFFAVRGYNSQSAAYQAALRVVKHKKAGQSPLILHLGDHDPSGIDMTRDNTERFEIMGQSVEVRRLALNMDQVEQYDPPPNPAKMTDSRVGSYIERFGYESWELDALEPTVLADLIRNAVEDVRDDALWQEAIELEEEHRRVLQQVSDRWDDVTDYLS
jgi:hypothetical protein